MVIGTGGVNTIGVSVLVDGGASLVITVALVSLKGMSPVLVAPHDIVARRNSVGESVGRAVVVDVVAVDIKDATRSVFTLVSNSSQTVVDLQD